jgi:hypothetical protein
MAARESPRELAMTSDERAQLIEDIKRSSRIRNAIVERAERDRKFDIAAAWAELDDLDASINQRVKRPPRLNA